MKFIALEQKPGIMGRPPETKFFLKVDIPSVAFGRTKSHFFMGWLCDTEYGKDAFDVTTYKFRRLCVNLDVHKHGKITP